MSLLDGGNSYEPITIYLEEVVTDGDGNIRRQPSTTPTSAFARFQTLNQSGTSERRSEQDNEGFESEESYNMRFPRSFTTYVGPQSEIVWNGARWAIFGFATRHNSSPRTAHLSYQIKRF